MARFENAKHLSVFAVSEAEFDKRMADWQIMIEEVPDVTEYFYGYKYCPRPKLSKRVMVYGKYKQSEYLICQEYKFNPGGCKNVWRQIILRKDKTVCETERKKELSGNYCYNYVMGIVRKHYSENEIDACFSSHTAAYDPNLAQMHVDYAPAIAYKMVYRLTDCVKYDINGAHCDALCEIFPKCREEFTKLYEKRKKKPEIKQYFNFCVGQLTNKGHRATYNWIVQRTTGVLAETIGYCGGKVIYANTDGVILQRPERLLEGSKRLGDFKEEYRGDVYFYQDRNYNLYQCGKDKVGRCRIAVRDEVDLRKGEVVHYDIRRRTVFLRNGKYEEEYLDNVKKETLEICRK